MALAGEAVSGSRARPCPGRLPSASAPTTAGIRLKVRMPRDSALFVIANTRWPTTMTQVLLAVLAE